MDAGIGAAERVGAAIPSQSRDLADRNRAGAEQIMRRLQPQPCDQRARTFAEPLAEHARQLAFADRGTRGQYGKRQIGIEIGGDPRDQIGEPPGGAGLDA